MPRKLIHRARADNRRGDDGLRQQPRQRNVGGMLAQFLAEILITLELVVMLFHAFLKPFTGAATFTDLLQHAAEQPTRQRTPGDQPKP